MDRNGWIEGLTERIKKYRYAALVILLGIVLMLLPKSGEQGASSEKKAAETFDRAALQSEMERILSDIQGVGKLRLMLTVSGGAEYELAQDESYEKRQNSESSGEYSEKTETVVLGSGSSAQVVITGNRYPAFVGALVVCEGADSAGVRLQLTQAVSALTGLSSEKISIVKGKP